MPDKSPPPAIAAVSIVILLAAMVAFAVGAVALLA
jgi:hypothetical protein